jgi:hypothetical protein
MTHDPPADRARQLWVELAGAPVSFPDQGIEVVPSAASRLCPPGIATIPAASAGGTGTGSADDGETGPATGLRGGPAAGIAGLPIGAVRDIDRVRAVLNAAETLGPATLAYLDRSDFRPANGTVERMPADHDDVLRLVASVSAEDAGECGLDEITSAAFPVRTGADLVAAAGYCRWPGQVAHLSVLTATAHRGHGFAARAASAAVEDALRHGLLPQWRARPPASRRVAARLGFRELGAQVSLRFG